jgi:hypothetical protein
MQDEKLKQKTVRNRKVNLEPVQHVSACDVHRDLQEGVDVVRQFAKNCRVFRERFFELKKGNRVTKKRVLVELISLLLEMEKEAGSGATKLRELLPSKPITQAELDLYLAARTVRPQAG